MSVVDVAWCIAIFAMVGAVGVNVGVHLIIKRRRARFEEQLLAYDRYVQLESRISALEPRTCAHCGTSIAGYRRQAIYCGGACRAAASRKRAAE